MLTLQDMLDTAEALEKRASCAVSGEARDALLMKKTMIDVAAFGQFKAAFSVYNAGTAADSMARGALYGGAIALPIYALKKLTEERPTAPGRFKTAWTNSPLAKGLAWGTGLAIPTALVGHHLINKAHDDAKDVVHDARNQALLTAAGIGGMKTLGEGLQRLIPHKYEHSGATTYPGGDVYSSFMTGKMAKLAAILYLDDFLENQLNQTRDKTAEECFVYNREVGMALLREILS